MVLDSHVAICLAKGSPQLQCTAVYYHQHVRWSQHLWIVKGLIASGPNPRVEVAIAHVDRHKRVILHLYAIARVFRCPCRYNSSVHAMSAMHAW